MVICPWRKAGEPILPMHGTVAGFWLFAEDEGAQLAMMGHPPRRAVATLDKGRQMTIRVPVGLFSGRCEAVLRAIPLDGAAAEVTLRLESGAKASAHVDRCRTITVRLAATLPAQVSAVLIDVAAPNGPASIPRVRRSPGSPNRYRAKHSP